jgi:hypothetical protein
MVFVVSKFMVHRAFTDHKTPTQEQYMRHIIPPVTHRFDAATGTKVFRVTEPIPPGSNIVVALRRGAISVTITVVDEADIEAAMLTELGVDSLEDYAGETSYQL